MIKFTETKIFGTIFQKQFTLLDNLCYNKTDHYSEEIYFSDESIRLKLDVSYKDKEVWSLIQSLNF